MKYSSKQYAKIFSSLLEKAGNHHQKSAVKSFALMLEQNGDLKNESDILYAIEKTLYENAKTLKVEVTEAKNHPTSRGSVGTSHLNLPEKVGHKHAEVKKEIDANLIGGIKIKIGDMVVDNSIQLRIKNLKQAFK